MTMIKNKLKVKPRQTVLIAACLSLIVDDILLLLLQKQGFHTTTITFVVAKALLRTCVVFKKDKYMLEF